ncbi:SDR family oxidoreductase [Glaciihabitans sp. dw_435]|uniref:SDR family oxidoreductase n=1 Tax=Glaciihabitans sp. dw_435 TaxID=2720081 RepID=UPI001BD60A9E|nr:SDR family oxidoreductase [Glaciihabitans sp. dw_435]
MTSTPTLTGRVAVIVGASSGIGEATARRLAAAGASVALIARRADRLEAIAADIRRAGGTALVIAADVTDSSAVREAAAAVKNKLGSAGILFNNAGIMLPAPIGEHRDDQWKTQIDLNVSALVTTVGAFVDQLVETAATGAPADLISTGSVAGEALFTNFAVYSGTKAFVKHFTTTLRAELGPKGVRVGSIAPGLVQTELANHVTDKNVTDWLAEAQETMTALTAADIAEVVTFAVSLPSHVNLQHITIMPTRQVV